MDRSINNAKRNLLVAELWESYETTSRRGLATLFDPVLLPSPPYGLLIAGTELASQLPTDGGRLKVWEHRQVWLCTPVASES